MNHFVEIQPQELRDNPFKIVGSDWMLITAGNLESFNTMTASWGTMGHLWQRNVCLIFVRPQRYTYEFTERNDYFTLTFFEETYRNQLWLCGSKSGRDTDKIAETGFTPRETKNGNIYFDEARLVIECRKIFYEDIKLGVFTDTDVDQEIYPEKDYHRMYIGLIETILRRRE